MLKNEAVFPKIPDLFPVVPSLPGTLFAQILSIGGAGGHMGKCLELLIIIKIYMCNTIFNILFIIGPVPELQHFHHRGSIGLLNFFSPEHRVIEKFFLLHTPLVSRLISGTFGYVFGIIDKSLKKTGTQNGNTGNRNG